MNRKQILLQILILFICITMLSVQRVQAQNISETNRIYGDDRYSTSLQISKFGWQSTADNVILVTGEDFPDALSAAPLAAKYYAPIMLTDSKTISKELNDELIRLKVKNVFIVGGTGVISKNIELKLNNDGIKYTRVYGNSRYETSVAVAQKLGSVSSAVIATGQDFPDALSIAPWAAQNHVPILLTEKNRIPEAVKKFIKDSNITKTYVIGGSGVINDSVLSNLPNPTRIWGSDRYQTNLAVLKTLGSGFNYQNVYVATGNDFPDALSGTALASMTKSPIILTDSAPAKETGSFINTVKNNIGDMYALGGKGVVSDVSINSIVQPAAVKLEVGLDETSINVKQKIKLPVTVEMMPKNAAANIEYKTSNSKVASVSSDGTVIGIAPGSVIVTISAAGKTCKVTINVKEEDKKPDDSVDDDNSNIIVIDAGHGGNDTGAIPTGSDGKTKIMESCEKVLNLQIADKVKNRLEKSGFTVVMTRDDDTFVPLAERADIANKKKAKLFLCIHHNAAGSNNAYGNEVYYSSVKTNLSAEEKSGVVEDSKNLAVSINNAISGLGLKKRGAKDNDYAVLRLTNMPSVLVEVGFITTYDEFQKISADSFQDKVADKISESITSFFKNKKQ